MVVEVVSKSSFDRDYRVKQDEYLDYGLVEYWDVDFLQRKLTLFTRNRDAWIERPCVAHRRIPSLVLRGLTAKMVDLWTDLDDYEADVED